MGPGQGGIPPNGLPTLCYIQILRRQNFKIVSRRGLKWLECARFSRFAWLVHAFSTRIGGVSKAPAEGLNFGHLQSDRSATVEQNRKRFFARLTRHRFSPAMVQQVHSAEIFQVALSASGRLVYIPSGLPPRSALEGPPQADVATDGGRAGDALVTAEPAILLAVRSADCMPVLLVDPRRRVVAAVHAGWRGLLGRVAEKAVGEIVRLFGSRPKELLAALGPSIRACCYPVGPEVVDAFCGSFLHGEKYFQTQPGKGNRTSSAAHLDLAEVARDQLRSAGLTPRHIETAEFCTACRTDLFYSYRKEGSSTGRMMAVVGIAGVGLGSKEPGLGTRDN